MVEVLEPSAGSVVGWAVIVVAAPDAPAGEIANGVLVTPVKPFAPAESRYPLPARSINRLGNVATPPTALTVVIPDSVPPEGLTAMAIVTVPVKDVWSAPVLSTARTVTAGNIGRPACVLVGCWPNSSRKVVGGTNVNVTSAVSEIVVAPSRPLIVAVAGADGAVSSAVYVPSPISETGPRLPAVVARV